MAVSYRVASRYAKSILELAVEQNVLEAVKADMLLFVQVCDENRDFSLMLDSPIINHGKKLEILRKVFGGKISELTDKFFTLITKKNRESDLYGIAKEFAVKYNIHKGIQVARIETSVALTPTQKKEFTDVVAKLMNKEVDLQEKINEELIGGYILRVEDKQIDQSIKGNLLKLKQRFASR